MIEVYFNWAAAIYLSSVLFLVLIRWIFYNCHEEPLFQKSEQLLQCTFCGHIFFNYQESEILSCPLCKSYIESRKKKSGTAGNTNENKNIASSQE